MLDFQLGTRSRERSNFPEEFADAGHVQTDSVGKPPIAGACSWWSDMVGPSAALREISWSDRREGDTVLPRGKNRQATRRTQCQHRYASSPATVDCTSLSVSFDGSFPAVVDVVLTGTSTKCGLVELRALREVSQTANGVKRCSTLGRFALDRGYAVSVSG